MSSRGGARIAQVRVPPCRYTPGAIPAMLTTSIIFTVLVAAWGYVGDHGRQHRGDR